MGVKRMKSLAFGEVLWDIFESGREIGGAPFNFSAHIAKLGLDSFIVTAVGKDPLGDEPLKIIKNLGVKTDFVSAVAQPTGTCIVTVDENSQPSYNLTMPAAWDYIEPSPELINRAASGEFDLFYFGTLALRNTVSFTTLKTLLNRGSFGHVFCDLNLRQNYHSREIIEFALKACSILKINREELASVIKEKIICPDSDFEAACKQLAEGFDIKIILLTLDKDGAFIYKAENGETVIPQKPVNKAVSCVGAGDSFSACFLANYLHGHSLSDCAERAIMLSDFVVTKYGAIPDYPSELYAKIKP